MFVELLLALSPLLILTHAENFTLDRRDNSISDCCSWTTNGFYYQGGDPATSPGQTVPYANSNTTYPLDFWWVKAHDNCGLSGTRAFIHFHTKDLPVSSIRFRYRTRGRTARLAVVVYEPSRHVFASYTSNEPHWQWAGPKRLPSDVTSVTVEAEVFTANDRIEVDVVMATIDDDVLNPSLRRRRSVNDDRNRIREIPPVKGERGDQYGGRSTDSSTNDDAIADDQTEDQTANNGDGHTTILPAAIPMPGPSDMWQDGVEDFGSYVIVENDTLCITDDDPSYAGTKADYYPTDTSRGPCLWGCSLHGGAGASDEAGESFTWCWPAMGQWEKLPCTKTPHEDVHGNGCAGPCTVSSDGLGRCPLNLGGQGQCSTRVELYRAKYIESYGHQCVTRCAPHFQGNPENYCYFGKGEYGKCSAYPGLTYQNVPCTNECSQGGYAYYWCWSGMSWDYCSPVVQV